MLQGYDHLTSGSGASQGMPDGCCHRRIGSEQALPKRRWDNPGPQPGRCLCPRHGGAQTGCSLGVGTCLGVCAQVWLSACAGDLRQWAGLLVLRKTSVSSGALGCSVGIGLGELAT